MISRSLEEWAIGTSGTPSNWRPLEQLIRCGSEAGREVDHLCTLPIYPVYSDQGETLLHPTVAELLVLSHLPAHVCRFLVLAEPPGELLTTGASALAAGTAPALPAPDSLPVFCFLLSDDLKS